jgi:hypothetical protein
MKTREHLKVQIEYSEWNDEVNELKVVGLVDSIRILLSQSTLIELLILKSCTLDCSFNNVSGWVEVEYIDIQSLNRSIIRITDPKGRYIIDLVFNIKDLSWVISMGESQCHVIIHESENIPS